MSYRSGVVHGLIAIRWGRQPEAADVPGYAAEIALARERQGNPLVGLFIMPVDSRPPSDDFRKVQASFLPAIMINLDFAVAVFEGSGFTTSLRRSALVAILLLAPKRFPIYVRSTVEEALIHNPPKPITFDPVEALEALWAGGILTSQPGNATRGAS